MQYVAIDFETANRYPNSACSVGLAHMDEEGTALEEYYTLIRPPVLYFDPLNTSIHHLDDREVRKAPTMEDLWPEISSFIGSLPLVAHNAQFDIRVLRATLEAWGLEAPHNDYYCTLSLARRVWKDRPSYKLTSLASGLGWEYEAHNALADCLVCGRLFARLCGEALYDDESAQLFFRQVYKKDWAKRYPRKV